MSEFKQDDNAQNATSHTENQIDTNTNNNNDNNNNNNDNNDNNNIKDEKKETTKKSGIDTRYEGDILVEHNNMKLNPYEAMIKSFEDLKILPQKIVDATIDLNWEKPSKIQATALPILLNNSKKPNLIAQAHHGSGKTGTFVITMLSLINFESKNLQSLILCHSRELAIQTLEVIGQLGSYYSNLRVSLAVPGQEPPVPWNCQICVGTPGTLLFKYIKPELYKDFNEFLKDFKIFIIDEADEFLKSQKNSAKFTVNKYGKKVRSKSLFDQMMTIYERLKNHGPKSFQKLLFSATFPKQVKKLAAKIANPSPVILTLQRSQVALDNIKLYKINCFENNNNNNNIDNNNIENIKFNTLLTLISLGNIGQIIVFVNSKKKAKELISKLENKQLKCSALFGGEMKHEIRDKTMKQFRLGQTVCLIASNVIARGIDVPAVGLVVNYEIPIEFASSNTNDNNNNNNNYNNNENFDDNNKLVPVFDSETFMHRVGRCGRFGAPGVCINLIDGKRSQDTLKYILDDFTLKCEDLSTNKKDIKIAIQTHLNIDDEE